MDDYEVIDLREDHGQIAELTLWYSDDWELNYDTNRFEADCCVVKGQLEIGNWRVELDRPALIQMIGSGRLKAYEDERAALLEMQGVAA